MNQLPEQCPADLQSFCKQIKSREIEKVLNNPDSAAQFFQGLRKACQINQTAVLNCYMINGKNCALSPGAWVHLSEEVQRWLSIDTEPLEHL